MFYKVVSIEDNRFVSAYVYDTIFQQEYKVDEFVFSCDNQPFMVFDSLERAITFKEMWGDAIFQCEVVNPRKYFNNFISDLRSKVWYGYLKEFILEFFKDRHNKNEIIPGTLFCDGVRLRNRIR